MKKITKYLLIKIGKILSKQIGKTSISAIIMRSITGEIMFLFAGFFGLVYFIFGVLIVLLLFSLYSRKIKR